ncbi:MAG TPA: hypothetical protein VIG24_02270, partial [Acidimicrobiia bacterium]
MARRRGGYRQPSSPAAVSGPGSLSARTDGGPGDSRMGQGLPYGQNQQVNQLQGAAPMQSQGGNGGGQPQPQGGNRQSAFAGTDRMDEPMTAGIDMGPGDPGPDDLPPMDDRDLLVRAMLANPTLSHLHPYLMS